VFSGLSSRGALAVASKAYFRVYLVAVHSPRQAKCEFSRLSCRGASAAQSKASIFAFFLSRCARREQQSVNFRVYLVMVRSSCGHSQVISPFYLLTCTHSEASFLR